MQTQTRKAAVVLLAAAALLASAARAQEGGFSAPLTTRESRQTNALEIAVGLGSAEGFGKTESGGPSLDTMGLGADVSVGWRINPRWMVGAYSSSALYSAPGGASSTLGTSAGVQAQYHFGPGGPWVGVGAGWHGYWISHDGVRSSYQGVDLARLQLGLEVPITPSFSLEPMLGVTLTTFATQKAPAGAASDASSGSLSAFVLSARWPASTCSATPPASRWC